MFFAAASSDRLVRPSSCTHVVAEGRPMCHDNMIEGQVMNGSHFEIVCTLVYYGLFHPKLLIKDPTGVELQTTTEIDLWQRFRRGTITVNATMLAKSVHHMKTVEINVSYNISNEQHETNFIAPKYNYAKFTTHSRRVFVCCKYQDHYNHIHVRPVVVSGM